MLKLIPRTEKEESETVYFSIQSNSMSIQMAERSHI